MRSLLLLLTSAHMALALPLLELDNDLADDGQLWALLVAGSNGYYNYRHQADVCHSYQVVRAHGIPEENIVVMMYDDIAYNDLNPTQGIIVNAPNGTNVYAGVPHDYTKEDNNPENFLNILQGKDMNGVGSGKTIKSGPNDHIFVYFTDHGAPGILGFGDTFLKASDLIKVLNSMHDEKKYGKMVIYIEACESGSMFKNLLPEDISIYATTASNETSSSYACYYDPIYKTYLGDVYSIEWLRDSDSNDLNHETLENQYLVVKNKTNTSEVCQFGDMAISQLPVSDFQGEKESAANPVDPADTCGADAIPAPEVHRVSLEKIIASGSPEEQAVARKELDQLLGVRRAIESTVRNIVDRVTQNSAQTTNALGETPTLTEHGCYYTAVDLFDAQCWRLGQNEHALRMLYALANLCQMKFSEAEIAEAISKECAVKEPIIETVG